MKVLINICRENEDKSLTVIGEKKLVETLDDAQLKTSVIYNGKVYEVLGNCFFPFIIIENQ